jgi:hypothetical protein
MFVYPSNFESGFKIVKEYCTYHQFHVHNLQKLVLAFWSLLFKNCSALQWIVIFLKNCRHPNHIIIKQTQMGRIFQPSMCCVNKQIWKQVKHLCCVISSSLNQTMCSSLKLDVELCYWHKSNHPGFWRLGTQIWTVSSCINGKWRTVKLQNIEDCFKQVWMCHVVLVEWV